MKLIGKGKDLIDFSMISHFEFLFFLINSLEILLIDWDSSVEIDSNVKYSGTLSTASTFILENLANNENSSIKCLPIDDCISLLKMILIEIIPKCFREAILLKVRQGSLSGILGVYNQIRSYFKKYTTDSIACD